MSSSSEIPTLRIVPTDSLVLHEDVDPHRVAPLMQRLVQDRVLKNPPIVAPLPDGSRSSTDAPRQKRYVVLDGANRVSALRALNIRDTLVQVVDYFDPELKLDTWFHLVAGVKKQELHRAIQAVPGIQLRETDLETARELLERRSILAYLVCPEGDVLTVEGGHGFKAAARLLKQITDTYRSIGTIYRVKTDAIDQLGQFYDEIAAILVFQPYRPQDIINLATDNAKLPTGVTRHVIPRRALRVNMSLELLAAETPIEEKNAWLERWVKEKLARKEIRFYQESTFLFDE